MAQNHQSITEIQTLIRLQNGAEKYHHLQVPLLLKGEKYFKDKPI
jgi:hypothetical protein